MEDPIFARDMDLVRAVLGWAEHGGVQGARPQADPVRLCHHVKIMNQAGLIEGVGECHKVPGTGRWDAGIAHVTDITWQGSEFLVLRGF